jgi:hypothetical protein
MSDVKIFSQQKCSYRHIQDTVAMLPTALREVDPQAKPDIVKALQAITMAVAGSNKNLFFAVAEVSGVTAGFICGVLSSYTFEDRTFGQDILTYVRPEYRDSAAVQEITKQFSNWCFGLGAFEVRGLLMHTDEQSYFASTAKQLGYTEVGKMIFLRRAE